MKKDEVCSPTETWVPVVSKVLGGLLVEVGNLLAMKLDYSLIGDLLGYSGYIYEEETSLGFYVISFKFLSRKCCSKNGATILSLVFSFSF